MVVSVKKSQESHSASQETLPASTVTVLKYNAI